MAANEFAGLKNQTVTMKDAKDVRSTSILDGEAKDSPVANENNKTEQYKTDKIPTKDLGGRNNLDG